MNKAAIILPALIVICLLCFSYYLNWQMPSEKQLYIEDLAECLNIFPDEAFKAETQSFLDSFYPSNFSDGYKKVYRQLSLESPDSDPIRKAAVAALTIASQNFHPSLEDRKASIRLLIQYLSEYQLSTDSAQAWTKLDQNYSLFSADATNTLLFRQYLR